MAEASKDSELLPIGYAARMSGVSAHTIRMWERRYGTVEPSRTETNRRMYTRADVHRLQLVQRLSDRGFSVSKTSPLPTERLEELERESATSPASAPPARKRGESEDLLVLCKHAVSVMDGDQLLRYLQDGLVSGALPSLIDNVIAPLIQWIGSCWQSGDLRIANEHLATQTIVSFLDAQRRRMVVPDAAPKIIVATPAAQVHELGARLAAITARDMGWCDIFYGADLPAHEIAHCAIEHKAAAVLLSVVMAGDRSLAESELEQLRAALPAPFPIILGGSAAQGLADLAAAREITVITELGALRETLSTLAGV